MKVVTPETFDEVLKDSPGLVLVDFFADWCGPCKTLGPILEGLAPEYDGRVTFVKVDSDRSPALSQAFGVRSLPTVVLLKPRDPGPGADAVNYFIGVKPPNQIRALLDKALDTRPGLLGRLFGRGTSK